MKKNYKCSFCGKGGVKLWHPMQESAPLICANCAEVRQSKIFYNEYAWSRDKTFANLTGRKLPLDKWKVDKNGEVPSYVGPGPDGKPLSKTTTLIIDLEDITTVSFVPASETIAWTKLPTA